MCKGPEGGGLLCVCANKFMGSAVAPRVVPTGSYKLIKLSLSDKATDSR